MWDAEEFVWRDVMAITEEEVVWCYRSILGREPESAHIIQQQIGSTKDFRALVLRFITSPEYQQRMAQPALVPLERKDIEVDVTASAVEMSLLRERIRETWTRLGIDRPHHSVISGENYLPQAINPDTIERFYASGADEVAIITALLARYGFSQMDGKICIEYGCGLGRVTLDLAKLFKRVHGYDISANHLKLAAKRASERGIKNVDFHLCSAESITENLVPCDFFYSRIVFQHNPPPVIRELITTSLKSLRKRGISIFQVPTYGAGYSFHVKDYIAKPRQDDIEMHCIPQAEVFSLILKADCKILEVREDTAVGRYGQWISNTFVVQRR